MNYSECHSGVLGQAGDIDSKFPQQLQQHTWLEFPVQ